MKKQRMERRRLPIGVFDSGVGGLSVLQVLKERFPHEDFIYVGDSANNPVGNRSNEEISRLALRIARFLEQVPVKLAVVACNTFTVASLEVLRNSCAFPVVGMSKGVRTAIDVSPRKKIAIMATKATIDSHHHAEEVAKQAPSVAVCEQACPALAHCIEEGHLQDDIVRRMAADYMQPIIDEGADTVVLGCTHYPLIRPVLEELGGQDIIYVDPSYETAHEVKEALIDNGLETPNQGEGQLELCFTSDIGPIETMAANVLSSHTFSIRKVTL